MKFLIFWQEKNWENEHLITYERTILKEIIQHSILVVYLNCNYNDHTSELYNSEKSIPYFLWLWLALFADSTHFMKYQSWKKMDWATLKENKISVSSGI